MTTIKRLLPTFLLLHSSTNALDIILQGFECNESLPVYVTNNDMELNCGGSDKCTMGTDAVLSGKVHYTGVEDLGLADVEDLGLVTFVSADLNFLSLEFDLLQYLQVPICGQYISPEGYSAEANGNDDGNANANGCPADGVYDFNITYFLPEEETKASWLATGWKGEGEVSFYAGANNADTLMGSCQLHFATAVSQADSDSFLAKVPIPSSFVTAAVLFAFVCFLILTCLYRMVRDIASGKKKEKRKQLDEESCAATEFVSMQD